MHRAMHHGRAAAAQRQNRDDERVPVIPLPWLRCQARAAGRPRSKGARRSEWSSLCRQSPILCRDSGWFAIGCAQRRAQPLRSRATAPTLQSITVTATARISVPKGSPTRSATTSAWCTAASTAATNASATTVISAHSSGRLQTIASATMAAIGAPMLQRGSACENSAVIVRFVVRLSRLPRIPLPPSFRVSVVAMRRRRSTG